MKKFTKQLLTGVVALGLLAPVGTSALNNNPRISVNARSRALSYYRAKKAVRKAYNGKDRYGDHFRLHNDGRHGNRTYLKAIFGANAIIYFRVTHSGRYAHIHTLIRASAGEANKPGIRNVKARYYHFYRIHRNRTVRAY